MGGVKIAIVHKFGIFNVAFGSVLLVFAIVFLSNGAEKDNNIELYAGLAQLVVMILFIAVTFLLIYYGTRR